MSGSSQNSTHRHAVVIGGSMAGLLSAAVLSRYCRMVTVLERDSYPEGPSPRAGVPQAHHVHVLLSRGGRILERLFPGITLDLISKGGSPLDSARDFNWLTPCGYGPRFQCGYPVLAASRALIDWAVLPRVRRLGNVNIVEEATVAEIVGIERGSRVQTRVLNQEQPLALHADLIVDATGRGSKTPDLLARLGFERPEETVVDGKIGYASRLFRQSEGALPGARAAYSQAAPPANCRTGIVFPVEGGLWHVSLAGGGGDYPPTDADGFLEFARSLPNQDIYRVARTSEPVSEVRGFRNAANRIRHYERIRMPEGLIVTGDAACAFNPVYGQGMTTAAIGAEVLERCLEQGKLHKFQRRLSEEMRTPWMLASSEDVRYAGAVGGSSDWKTVFQQAYVDRVIDLSIRNQETRRSLLGVMHLEKPPSSLFRPEISLRVALECLKSLLSRGPMEQAQEEEARA
jgi:2-polyprenyl-6-methoxyphenol hydroxylase-like FAD-dependent oxidoreductase